MSFICEDNITMNPTTDTIIYEQENVFKDIKKPDLDDCYICLSAITNKPEFSAVFVFKCRHPICYDCLVDVSSKYAEDYIKHKMLCGICRSGTNRYLFNNKKLFFYVNFFLNDKYMTLGVVEMFLPPEESKLLRKCFAGKQFKKI
jgi:hypothetical protein